MQALNLPVYEFRIRNTVGRQQIFDPVRKKWVALTPEEWVRQNFVQYLLKEKNYPASLMVVEAKVVYNKKPQRSDVLVYNKSMKPLLVLECKAPKVNISQEVFFQAARYNSQLKAKYVIVTNGLEHFCCEVDYEYGKHVFLREIPEFSSLSLN